MEGSRTRGGGTIRASEGEQEREGGRAREGGRD